VFVPVQASVVDTIQTFSVAMQKNIKSVVVTPENYVSDKELPVVYLLHGYGGNYQDWIKRARSFEKAADQYNMIIVCPDGGFNSWYWDSPIDLKSKHETFISDELVHSIDAKYKTIKNPKAGQLPVWVWVVMAHYFLRLNIRMYLGRQGV
jgi:S-formylglutathione hydrolase FrmB